MVIDAGRHIAFVEKFEAQELLLVDVALQVKVLGANQALLFHGAFFVVGCVIGQRDPLL